MAKRKETKIALTLNVAPALEEHLFDWLLARDDATGFTSYAAHGHGARDDRLSVAEQVSGRQRRLEIRVELRASELDGLLAALARDHGGADLHWFVVPIVRSGRLGGDRP
jgi:hypothetical protein